MFYVIHKVTTKQKVSIKQQKTKKLEIEHITTENTQFTQVGRGKKKQWEYKIIRK